MSPEELSQVLRRARIIVEEVGQEVLGMRRELRTARSKAGVDVVTAADEFSERELSRRLHAAFPDHGIRCEEGTVLGPADAALTWHVDPLDGTANFARDIANWTVSIGLASGDEPILGAVHAPYWGGSVFGARGLGAWNNEDPLEPAAATSADEAKTWIVATDWPWDVAQRPLTCRFLEHLAPHIRQYKTFGSSCLDQFNLAKGLIDAYVIPGVFPWDLAGGCACLRELGYSILDWDGGTWDLSRGDILACRPGMEDLLLAACQAARS